MISEIFNMVIGLAWAGWKIFKYRFGHFTTAKGGCLLLERVVGKIENQESFKSVGLKLESFRFLKITSILLNLSVHDFTKFIFRANKIIFTEKQETQSQQTPSPIMKRTNSAEYRDVEVRDIYLRRSKVTGKNDHYEVKKLAINCGAREQFLKLSILCHR